MSVDIVWRRRAVWTRDAQERTVYVLFMERGSNNCFTSDNKIVRSWDAVAVGTATSVLASECLSAGQTAGGMVQHGTPDTNHFYGVTPEGYMRATREALDSAQPMSAGTLAIVTKSSRWSSEQERQTLRYERALEMAHRFAGRVTPLAVTFHLADREELGAYLEYLGEQSWPFACEIDGIARVSHLTEKPPGLNLGKPTVLPDLGAVFVAKRDWSTAYWMPHSDAPGVEVLPEYQLAKRIATIAKETVLNGQDPCAVFRHYKRVIKELPLQNLLVTFTVTEEDKSRWTPFANSSLEPGEVVKMPLAEAWEQFNFASFWSLPTTAVENAATHQGVHSRSQMPLI